MQLTVGMGWLAPGLGLVLAACATAPPEASAPGGCVARPDAVRVLVRAEPPAVDTGMSTAQLAAIGEGGGLRPAHGRLAGLYAAEFQLAAQIRVERRGDCLDPDVRLALNVTRGIRIASEYPPGTCRHAVALAHEQEHAAIDDALLQEADRRIGDPLRALLDAPGALAGGPPQPLAQLLRDAIGPAMAGFERERTRRQLAIDTPAEYARLSRACAPGA
jgi:hypothetical protein